MLMSIQKYIVRIHYAHCITSSLMLWESFGRPASFEAVYVKGTTEKLWYEETI